MVGFSSRPTHRHPPLPLSIAFPDSVDRFDASHGRLIAGATNPRLGGGAVPPLPCPSSPVVRIIEAELTRRGIRAIIAAVLKSCCDRPIRTRQKYLLLPSHGVCVCSRRGGRGSDAAESRGEERRVAAFGARQAKGEEEREREESGTGIAIERDEDGVEDGAGTERGVGPERASEQASIFAGLDAATEGDAPLLANTLRNREPVASGRAHTRARPSERARVSLLSHGRRTSSPSPSLSPSPSFSLSPNFHPRRLEFLLN